MNPALLKPHGWEVGDASWFSLDDAVKMVSCKGGKGMIEKAREALIYGKDLNLG